MEKRVNNNQFKVDGTKTRRFVRIYCNNPNCNNYIIVKWTGKAYEISPNIYLHGFFGSLEEDKLQWCCSLQCKNNINGVEKMDEQDEKMIDEKIQTAFTKVKKDMFTCKVALFGIVAVLILMSIIFSIITF